MSRAHERRLHALRAMEAAGDHRGWVRSATRLYHSLADRDADEAALRDLRASLLARADAVRAGFCSRAGRLLAGEDLDVAFGILLRDVLERAAPDPGEVFRLTEASRARMLLDAIAGHWRQPTATEEAALVALEQASMAFDVQDMTGTTWQEMKHGSERALGVSVEEVREIEDRYAAAGAGFDGVAPVPEVAAVQDALEEDEVLIEYVIPHHPHHPAYALWALVVDKSEARLIPLNTDPLAGSEGLGVIGRLTTDNNAPIDTSPLGEAVGQLRVAIQDDDPSAYAASLQALHALLVAPILPLDRYARAIVVPHRMLHAVPFAALCDATGVALQDHVTVVTAMSAASWLALRQRPAGRAERCVAFGNPTLDPALALPPLPDAEREVDDVERLLDRLGVATEVLVRDRATEAAFAAQAPGAGILYLATHGERPDVSALDRHGVLLAPSDDADGALTAQEVRRLDLSDTWLVVLSVCNGGLFRFAPGDEPLGLVPALMAAGADNVVGALWPIDDAAGRALMTRAMGTALDQGPAGALAEAATTFQANGKMPLRDWAAFVCIGSGLPPG